MVIHAGTNNTPDESSKKVISRFNSLIDDIRKRVPDIQVFVSAILPRDVSFFPGANNDLSRLDQCNQRAVEINNYLRQRKDVIFIDHPRFGTSRQSANRRLLSTDGLHMTTAGVRELKEDIESAVRFHLRAATSPRRPRIVFPPTTPVSISYLSFVEDVCFSDADFPQLPTLTPPPPTKPTLNVQQPTTLPTVAQPPPTKVPTVTQPPLPTKPTLNVQQPPTKLTVTPPPTTLNVQQPTTLPTVAQPPPTKVPTVTQPPLPTKPTLNVQPPPAKPTVTPPPTTLTVQQPTKLPTVAQPPPTKVPTVTQPPLPTKPTFTAQQPTKLPTVPLTVSQIPCSNRFSVLAEFHERIVPTVDQPPPTKVPTVTPPPPTKPTLTVQQQAKLPTVAQPPPTKVPTVTTPPLPTKPTLNVQPPPKLPTVAQPPPAKTTLTDFHERQRGGGNGSVTFREDVDIPVSIDYSYDILRQCSEGSFEKELISTEAPIKPKGGDVFVIDTQNFSNKLSRRVDQYQWLHDGSKKYPASNPVVLKSSWRIKTASGNKDNKKGSASSAFKRMEYNIIGDDRFFLVQYIGDEKTFEDMPHGNAKKSKKNYVRTCPSTIDSVKESLETGLTAGKVYNNLKSSVDGQEAVSRAPRNLKQVENIYMSMRNKKRLTQDDVYNTLELAYQLDGFVMQFDIFPSLLLVLGLKEAVRDFNDLLQIKRSEKPFLSIDTTFETGNFYITAIVYKNFLFKSEPTVPLAFLIHEKKDQKFQERFLSVLAQECPDLKRKETVFVADRERALTNAISEKLPSATIVHCWNHVKRAKRTTKAKIILAG